MGQWGQETTENGVHFVVHINTEGNNPIREDSLIDYLCVLDAPYKHTDATIKILEKKYLYQRYLGIS